MHSYAGCLAVTAFRLTEGLDVEEVSEYAEHSVA